MTHILVDGHGPVSAPEHFEDAVAASATTRIVARLIDATIPIILAIPTTAVAWGVPLMSASHNPMELIGVAWVGSAFSFLVAVALVVMVVTRGQTFGMKIMGLRWVSMSDGRVHGGPALLKFVVEGLLGGVGVTPIIWLVTRDEHGRHWFSRFTNLITINTKKGRDTDVTPAPVRHIAPNVAPPPPWQAHDQEEHSAVVHTPQPPISDSPASAEGGSHSPAPMDEAAMDVDHDADHTVARRPANSILLSFDDGTHHYLVGQALIGRSPQASASHPDAQLISISDPERSISKLHIALSVHSGAVLVEDMHSLNGTTIITHEGQTIPVMPGAPILAPAGSTVHFGERTVKIGG